MLVGRLRLRGDEMANSRPELQGLKGPNGRLYAEPNPGTDPTSFQVNNTDTAYYSSAYYKAHEKLVKAVPEPTSTQPMNLGDFLPSQTMNAIKGAGKISFHAVGDTGAAKVNRQQSAATAIAHEDIVADAMAKEVQTGGDTGPAFFFHLGDVVYNFGEETYYYDQFYNPYRGYDRPIFAIPGNHDGVTFDPSTPSLKGFVENFCASAPGPAPNAGSLVRSLMTQPGVYFALDAPFVTVIGLYSNTLEGPGVISSQGGKFPIVTDDQLTFLQNQLTRLKQVRQNDPRAVVLAVHHPVVSIDSLHSGSLGIQNDLDKCCKAANVWPDLVLHGHAHLYQRFTRKLPGGQQLPYLIAGSGGYAATPEKGKPPRIPLTVGDHTLEIAPIVDFGYLTIETDGKTYLSASFKTADAKTGVTPRDGVKVDLVHHTVGPLGAGGSAAASQRTGGAKPASRSAGKAPAKSTGAKKTPARSGGVTKIKRAKG